MISKNREKCESCVWWDVDIHCLKITMPHEKQHCEDGECRYYVKANEEATNEWRGKFG